MVLRRGGAALNVDIMAELAKKTHIPLATGERIFTKWGFREILEKHAAMILQPDVCYAGGITELRLIAGMAEAYTRRSRRTIRRGRVRWRPVYQVAASIPNFLIQERGDAEQRTSREATAAGQERAPPAAHRAGPGHHDRRRQAGRRWASPAILTRFDPDDGSVVDW